MDIQQFLSEANRTLAALYLNRGDRLVLAGNDSKDVLLINPFFTSRILIEEQLEGSWAFFLANSVGSYSLLRPQNLVDAYVRVLTVYKKNNKFLSVKKLEKLVRQVLECLELDDSHLQVDEEALIIKVILNTHTAKPDSDVHIEFRAKPAKHIMVSIYDPNSCSAYRSSHDLDFSKKDLVSPVVKYIQRQLGGRLLLLQDPLGCTTSRHHAPRR